jgi:hypothetical protein
MKTLLLALALFVSPAAFACESLEGAWELTYAIYKDQDGSMKSLKVLSQGHFSFITQEKGKFSVAGAGTWSVKGGDYTEVVTYASLDRNLGKTYKFQCAMKDGVWIHSGKEDHLLIEEHWRRAK